MKQKLEHILGTGRVQEAVDLFPYLSMRLHCTAQYFFDAKAKEDLLHALTASTTLGIPFVMLGGGSNMVFQQAAVGGLVVKNSFAKITISRENDSEVDVEVGSGTSMAVLVQYLCERGYSGLEYQKGLPGTVGGAIYMNSKWTHPLSYVGDVVLGAVLADRQGKEKQVDKAYFAFAYDFSALQKTHEFVLNVTFRLQKMDSKIVIARAQETLEYRKKTQPGGKPTCGCFFRNISEDEQKKYKLPTKSAGYLIDQSGMKGVQSGSFAVSDIHANFIVNQGGDARPKDLKHLITLIKEKVRQKFGVELEEEVQIA